MSGEDREELVFFFFPPDLPEEYSNFLRQAEQSVVQRTGTRSYFWRLLLESEASGWLLDAEFGRM